MQIRADAGDGVGLERAFAVAEADGIEAEVLQATDGLVDAVVRFIGVGQPGLGKSGAILFLSTRWMLWRPLRRSCLTVANFPSCLTQSSCLQNRMNRGEQ